jgi:hypothetical protein
MTKKSINTQSVCEKNSLTLKEMIFSYRYHKNPFLHFIILKINMYKNTFSDLKWKLKNNLQKLFRGYSDSDCWNLPQAVAKFILPRIKHLRQNYNSLANRNHLITIDNKVIPYKADQKNLELKEDSTGYVEGYIDKEINKPISLDSSEYEYVLDEIIFALQMVVDEDSTDIGNLDRLYEVYPKGFDPIKDRQMFLTPQEDGTSLVEFKSKDNIQPDYSKLNKAYERQRNGLILLGLYFKDLWD